MRRWLVLLMVGAVLVRVAAALYLGADVTAMPGIYDQISYDMLARQVAAGRGFVLPEGWWPATRAGQPTAHWSYLYTSYLAAVYWVGDGNPLLARLLQAVLAGIVQTWLVFRIGRRVFDPRVGLAAAGISAFYAYFLYYSAALMTETFFILAVLWVVDVTTRMATAKSLAELGGRCVWLELGVPLGTAVLLRQLLLLLVPPLFVWLYWRTDACSNACSDGGAGRSVRGMAVTALVIAVMVAPWTLRNHRVFDEFVLLNTNAGYVLFWGNHPIHGDRFIPILPAGGPTYEDLIPEEVRHLNEAALDRALLRRGVDFILSDPGRYVALSASRSREYFKFWWSSESSTISNVSRVFSFGLILPFVLTGLVLSARRCTPCVELLVGFVTLYSLIHLLTWTLIRYRLPVDAVLVVFAGLGAVWAYDRLVRPTDDPSPGLR